MSIRQHALLISKWDVLVHFAIRDLVDESVILLRHPGVVGEIIDL